MPAVALVAVRTLHEYRGVAQALREDLTPYIVQPDSFPDVSARLLHDFVSVHVRKQAETKSLTIARVGESVDRDRRLRGVERLPDPGVQLVVADAAPERRLVVQHRRGLGRQAARWRT